jgi:tRNA(fMet)-specific endonuclease VapC
LRGYLLDTNVVSYWFTAGSLQHELITARIQSLPEDSLLALSAITLGEIEYGHRVVSPNETSVQADFLEFIGEQLPTVFPVEATTRLYYGKLRALLFEKLVPAGKKKSGLRPEQLVDPVTSLELGIQENDLWIAAQALEYNLVLVTADKLQRIREVAAELEIENWAA